jgi:hypothetical protein
MEISLTEVDTEVKKKVVGDVIITADTVVKVEREQTK